MERLARYYIPLLAIFLYFSGFYYISEYLRFLGITAGYRDFRLDQYIFFSFAVLYELFLFRYFSLSILLLPLVGLLVLVHRLPNYNINLGHPKLRILHPVFGKNEVQIIPFLLRVTIVGLISFMFLFYASATIGKNHACERLNSSRSTITLVGLKNHVDLKGHDIDKPFIKHFLAAHYNGRLTEVWRNSNFIYVGETITNCRTDPRHLYILDKDDFRFSVIKRVN